VFRRPWLDGLTALAAVLDASGDLGLATTVCLPAVRGPAQAAKAFAALDVLSGGRFVAGVGPGSSERDYIVGGVPSEDRFSRFEEAVRALRALLGRDREPFDGRFYSTAGVTLEPPPGQPGRPPIWLAGWGGPRGLRRAADPATAGLPPPTTPRRSASPPRGRRSKRAWMRGAATPIDSRTGSPPRGPT